MSKVKAIIFGVIVLLFFSMGVTIQVLNKKYKAEKADRERLWQNNLNLTAENRQNINLQYTLKEFKASMSTKIDSILKVAEIASKQVKTVTTINNYYIDSSKTIIRPEPVISNTDTIYPFVDTKNCFTITGYMRIVSDKPELTIQKREYKNEINLIGYQKRPHRFLFFRWGKKVTRVEGFSDCDKPIVQVIEVIKE